MPPSIHPFQGVRQHYRTDGENVNASRVRQAIVLEMKSILLITVALQMSCTVVCAGVGCGKEGVNIEVGYRASGAYALEVVAEDIRATCTFVLPVTAENSGRATCDNGQVRLEALYGRAEQKLVIRSNAVSLVTLRIRRDGTLITNIQFKPQYVTTDVDEDCNPTGCTSATYTL
jgi:hypothetical protein